MKGRSYDKAPLVRIAVGLMIGMLVGKYVSLPFSLWPIFAALVMVACLLRRRELWQSVIIFVCFVFLGFLLMVRQKDLLAVEWPENEVKYEAVVLTEPIEKPKTMAVDILLTRNSQKLKCYFYKDERSRALQVGDGLQIQSRINANHDYTVGLFNYRTYLETHGFVGSTYVSGWKWHKARISLSDLSVIDRSRLFFLQLRARLLHRLSSNGLGDEQYAVVAAMVLGDKSALTRKLKDTYSMTGASHVLALSGLHLGIIYMLLSLLFIGGRRRMISQLLMILSIWAYAFLVGLPISVIRSAVMLSVYALLSLGHRDRMSVNTLAFTAIVMLMVNPMSLYDVGFQLSFLAVLSILVWYPVFEGIIPQSFLMSHRFVRWLWSMLAVSSAAQLGTAPLVAYYFGRFSTLFLITNLVVIPVATLILYLSLMVLIVPSLAYLLNNIVMFLNTFLERVAALPCASIEGLHPSVLQTTMVYVVIAAVYMLVDRLSCISRISL